MCQASASSLCILLSLRPRRCRRPWMRRGLKRPSSSEAGEGLGGLVSGGCLLSGARSRLRVARTRPPPTRGRAHLQRWRSETLLLGRASCRRHRARQWPRSRQAAWSAPRGWRRLQGAGGMGGHSTGRAPGKGEGDTTEGSSEAGPEGPGQLALRVCFPWFPWPRFPPRCGAAGTTQAESRRSLCREGRWARVSVGVSAARRWRPARARGDRSGEVGRTRVRVL